MAELSRRTLSLALALTPGIGGKTLVRVLSRNDLIGRSIGEFLKIGEASLIEEYRFKAKQAEAWSVRQRTLIDDAKSLEERLDKFGVGMVTAADGHYPQLLEEMDPDPPGVLFYFGNQKILGGKTFTVMSSRSSSPTALDLTEKLTEEGVLTGEVLVTGHDTPEYQRAAVVPLRWGSPRIMCLDRGLFDCLGPQLKDEPFRAARLWRYQFDSNTDLAVSLAHPEKGYVTGMNAKRDRLIAGLSRRLDFVNINPKGNMEKIARLALKAGRAVRISDSFLGSREWTRYGAKMLDL